MKRGVFMKVDNVNHDFLYHAEIQYETKDAFNFKSAMGNSIKDLMGDIDLRLKELKTRNPKIVQVLYKPNTESINITPKVLSLIKLNPAYSSE